MEGKIIQGAYGRAEGSATRTGMRGYAESASIMSDYSQRKASSYLCFTAIGDGFGGPGRSDVAARLAVDTVHVALDPNRFEGEPEFRHNIERVLTNAIQEANSRLRETGAEADAGPFGTTLTCAALDSQSAVIAHVGNARAYVLTARGLRQVTKDHVEPSGDTGSRLTRALGVGRRVEVDVLRVPLRPGESLLLCTHGLYSAVTTEEMAGALLSTPDLQAACDWLVDAAVARGAASDATVTAWRMPGATMVSTAAAAQAQPGGSKRKRKRSRRFLVLLFAVVLVAGGAAAGWSIGSIWFKGKSSAKSVTAARGTKFSPGDVAVIRTSSQSDACYLAEDPGGAEQTQLYDGWKVKVVSAQLVNGVQWYKVEVASGGLSDSNRRGYVRESFLRKSG